jgi:DNA-binding beta-propeller fold protein YncE
LTGGYSVTVSPDGRNVYAAGNTDDAVAVFSRDSTTGRLSFRQVLKDGVDGVDGLDGAMSVTVSPDGGQVYAAALDDNAVAVFSRDSTTGDLSFQQVLKDGGVVEGLAEAYSVTVSPDGRNVYAAGAGDDAVAVFHVV